MVGLAVCCLAGCGKDAAPAYDRMNVILLRDLLNAMDQDDRDLAMKKLERMQELSPESSVVETLLRFQIDTFALEEANRRLADGDLQAAREALLETTRERGMTPRLADALDRLDALLAVKTYLDQGRKGSPREVAAAVAALPPTSAFPDTPAYKDWHAQQRELAAERLREFKATQVAEAVKAIGLAAVQGKDAAESFEKLAALDAENPLLQARRLADKQAFRASDWQMVSDAAARELVCYLFLAADHANLAAVREAMGDGKAATLPGMVVEARLAFEAGDRAHGARLVRRLVDEAVAPDLAVIAPANGLPLAPGGISVPGVLRLLYGD